MTTTSKEEILKNIQLPHSLDDEIYFVYQDHIVFISFSSEHDWPMQEYNCIHPFSPKYENSMKFDDTKDIPFKKYLSLYRHSDETWIPIEHYDSLPDKQWDVVKYAGVYIPTKDDISYLETLSPEEAKAHLYQLAVVDCKLYSAHQNGYIYNMTFSIYKARYIIQENGSKQLFDKSSDYRFESPEEEETIETIITNCDKDLHELVTCALNLIDLLIKKEAKR